MIILSKNDLAVVINHRGCDEMKIARVVRSYKLRLYPNSGKLDTARYTYVRYNQYMNMFLGRIFFGEKNISTSGTDDVVSKACYKAYLKIITLKKLQKKSNIKINVPYATREGCPAILEKSKSKVYDYWVSIPNMWDKTKRIKLPAKSHKALNGAIRQGWELSYFCEYNIINGNPYVIVFVKKVAPKMKKYKKIIGCDVGIKHSVVTSDGYLGHGLSKILITQKQRQAERRRQGHKISNKTKTVIKQILDIEAKRLIGRSIGKKASLAVESPARLANLRSGKLQGWARSYLQNRLTVLGQENGVMIIEVSPYQTSITCPKCGNVDKQNRVTRDKFICKKCKYTNHADIVGALNVAHKGTCNIRTRKNSEVRR